MEPMNLGSPTHSPSNSPNSAYLPPFMMGEINQPTAPRSNSLSPTKGRNLAFGSPPSIAHSSTPDTHMTRTKLFINSQSPNFVSPPHNGLHNASAASFANKTSGPPTQGLFDTLHKQPRINQSKDSSQTNACTFPNYSVNQSYMFNQSHNNQTMNESNFMDSSHVGSEEECWVTVFGFTSPSANVVFAHFANCGNIVDRLYTSQGNWAHICYSSRAEKLRALSLNGRQLSPGIMVGVIDCRDPPTSRGSFKSDNRVINNQSLTTTPRSLCPTPVPTSPAPQRANGFLSKAMEYVFGL